MDTNMTKYSLNELTDLAARVLIGAGAGAPMAEATARALVRAEAQGLSSHGLSRVGQYASHLRSGRVAGDAEPKVIRAKAAAVLIDAGEGLAFPACARAVDEAVTRARAAGACFAAVTNSHHFGVAADHLTPAADAGMVGLAFGNSPAAMPAWNGRRALFGTNPIAAVFPRRGSPALSIDLSLSEAARGKLMVAARDGKEIPPGWALDKDGRPTTDPKAGLAGMMCPAGGVKGAMLALAVELLAVALSGAAFGFEADSFFVEKGNRPRIGQAFLVVDPGALAGADVFHERIETLIAAMLADPDVRLPGARRHALAQAAQRDGIAVPPALMAELRAALN